MKSLGKVIIVGALLAIACLPLIVFLVWTTPSPSEPENVVTDIEESNSPSPEPSITPDIVQDTTPRVLPVGEEVRHDLSGVSFQALPDSLTPTFAVRNHSLCNTIYYDAFRLEMRIDGEWHIIVDEPGNGILTQVKTGESYRFVRDFGEFDILPGDYRMTKTFYCSANTDVKIEESAEFAVNERLPKTFRAEVTEVINSESSIHLCCGDAGLLVNSLTPVLEGTLLGINTLVNIWDNDYVEVLNAHGEPIPFSGIQKGSIVDIAFDGGVELSLPGCIPGAVLIQIVE